MVKFLCYTERMRGGRPPRGYTIVEVMIFTAVSGLLLVSSMALISGQQNKTQFSQGTREAESQIQDIINNIATGYYQNVGNLSCTAGTGSTDTPQIINSASDRRGTNQGCTFIGHVLQFAPDGNEFAFKDYVIVGRQFYVTPAGTKQNVDNLDAASPTAIATPQPGRSTVEASVVTTLPYGLRVQRVTYDNGGGNIPVGSLAFFSSFVQFSSGLQQSGAQSVDLVIVPGSSLNDSSAAAITQIQGIRNTSIKNPINGAKICLESGGTNQYAVISVGANGRATTALNVYTKGSEPGGVCT